MNLLLSDPAFLSVAAAVGGGGGGYDPDAQAYITAVEAADTAAGSPGGLETAVKDAINAFVVGCKVDSIWTAIKASCILAGARTLNGALVPLVGAAPTNNGFLINDYNRKTGLKGSGSAGSKYLNSNRTVGSDPQNNNHLVAYLSEQSGESPSGIIGSYAGTGFTGPYHYIQYLAPDLRFASRSLVSSNIANSNPTGFLGFSRETSNQFIRRGLNTSTIASAASSSTTFNDPILVFAIAAGASNVSQYSSARIAFYSIGESLNLGLLDARVTALINAFASAIP